MHFLLSYNRQIEKDAHFGQMRVSPLAPEKLEVFCQILEMALGEWKKPAFTGILA